MSKTGSLLIQKSTGEIVPFNQAKLRKSLLRSRANNQQIEDVLEAVINNLYAGISTKNIYQLAFKKLRSKSKVKAARYKLKSAIMELGQASGPIKRH